MIIFLFLENMKIDNTTLKMTSNDEELTVKDRSSTNFFNQNNYFKTIEKSMKEEVSKITIYTRFYAIKINITLF
jgi:hypothetical protein